MQTTVYATVGLFAVLTIQAYLLGCVNGALLVSRLCYGEDLRTRGSGNAGLTNFYRSYGPSRAPLVILTDMGKAAIAVLIGGVLAGHYLGLTMLGRLLAGLFCVIGHMFPVFYGFRGGKGILCGGTMLLLLPDWRIAAVSWAGFVLVFLVTRYVSLASLTATLCFPVTVWVCFREPTLLLPALLIAALIVYGHRENIVRLLKGTERRFRFHIHTSEEDK